MRTRGCPEISGRVMYLTSPEYFTEYAKKFIELGWAWGVLRDDAGAHPDGRGAVKRSASEAAREVKPLLRQESLVYAVPTKEVRLAAKMCAGRR